MTNRSAKATESELLKIIDGTAFRLGQELVAAEIKFSIPRASLEYIPVDSTIKRAMELVDPSPELKSKCREKVKLMVAFLHADHFARPTPRGEIKKQCRQIVVGLRKTRAALKRLSEQSRTWLLSCLEDPEFFVLGLNLVMGQAEQGEIYLAGKKGRHQAVDKLNAAAFSFQLIREFGKAAPTLTTNGPYFELASTLYEAATTIPNCDLTAYCRRFFKRYAST